MKLLLLAAALLLGFICQGQEQQLPTYKRWDASIQFGVNLIPESGVHFNDNGKTGTYSIPNSIVAPTAILTLRRILGSDGRWAIGGRFSITTLKRDESNYTDNSGLVLNTGGNYLGKPLISVGAIAGRKLVARKVDLWANIHVGYSYARMIETGPVNGSYNYNTSGGVAGIQFQAKYPLYRSLYASAATGVDFQYLSAGSVSGYKRPAYSVYSFPALIGIGYKF